MSKYGSARAVLAGAAVIALAGCGTSASTSPLASASSPPASTAAGASNPAAATGASPAATSGATSNSFVSAGSIPFPVAVGNTWVYETVTNINNLHALLTKKVLGVTSVPGGHRVTMSSTLSPGPTPNTTLETYLFYANGQIGFPVNEPHGISVISGNGVVWPDAADIASGRAFHSVLQVRLATGQYETTNVTVQGGGTESVAVPAGTYQATIVNMTMVMKVGSFTTTAVVKVWVAPGTGPVKSEELIQAAGKTQLSTTEALLSFTKQAVRADGS
jgi:hypothetical protein